jgi:hypothetical protein
MRTPEGVPDAFAFLSSGDSDSMTGSRLLPDGSISLMKRSQLPLSTWISGFQMIDRGWLARVRFKAKRSTSPRAIARSLRSYFAAASRTNVDRRETLQRPFDPHQHAPRSRRGAILSRNRGWSGREKIGQDLLLFFIERLLERSTLETGLVSTFPRY